MQPRLQKSLDQYGLYQHYKPTAVAIAAIKAKTKDII